MNDALGPRLETIYDAFGRARTRNEPYDASRSALYRNVGFIVGAPRSGTTWLQQLLFVHPHVATGSETHLFCEALPRLFEQPGKRDEYATLGTWVNRAELLQLARALCDGVFATMRAGTRPDATLILEKTPNHRLQAALQATLYPDARYVHIVRDGRDVTASQRQHWAGRLQEFAHAGEVASAWAAQIRDIRTHFGPLDYLEIRYEDIVADTAGALARIFDHLRLPHDRALCEAAAAFGEAPVNTYPTSPDVGIRKHRGDALAERSVARAAGDLLVELGYCDASDVDKLRSLRTRETVLLDGRDLLRRTARVRSVVRRVRARLGARASSRTEQATELASALGAAIERGDAEAVAALLTPGVRVNGATTQPAAAAASLVADLAGGRVAFPNVYDGQALITFLTADGRRRLLVITPQGGLAAEITTH
jgi:hypothetical protein